MAAHTASPVRKHHAPWMFHVPKKATKYGLSESKRPSLLSRRIRWKRKEPSLVHQTSTKAVATSCLACTLRVRPAVMLRVPTARSAYVMEPVKS